jgi:hypothetical protein
LLFFTVAVVIYNEYFVDHCFFGSVVLFVTGIIQNVVMYRRYNCPKCMDSSQFLAGLVVLSVFYVHRAWRRRVPRSLLLSFAAAVRQHVGTHVPQRQREGVPHAFLRVGEDAWAGRARRGVQAVPQGGIKQIILQAVLSLNPRLESLHSAKPSLKAPKPA